MAISAPTAGTIGTREQRELARAEARRLRREGLDALLDLTSTVATLANLTASVRLREVYRRTALTGQRLAQNLISMANGVESAGLEAKWNGVCEALAKFEIDERRLASPQTGGRTEHLTKREMEVLKWVALGKSTKEVAGILGMTFKTAACHRYRVMDKLGIHDAVSLTRYAIRNGLIQA